ncbi:MAG: cytochrome c biogenesis protein CcdA [Candidatus Saganbacteria bacterium]|nr:cytochrome c biogenesis protein CcdA [Candidatus Saganbacteria bacterium]
MQNVSFLTAFAAGLLSFFSPCILPLVPSYISYITGITFKDLESNRAAAQKVTLINSIFFVLGFSLVFILLGVAISFLGQLLIDIKEYTRIVGGFIIIFFGLFIMGVFNSPLLNRYLKFAPSLKAKNSLSSFLAGLIFASGWTPCVGPILGTILILAGTTSSILSGTFLLCFYCAGLAVPFLISALMVNSLISFIPKISKYMRYITFLSGLLLIITGILLILNLFNSFSGI